jgi:hypothetical protein
MQTVIREGKGQVKEPFVCRYVRRLESEREEGRRLPQICRVVVRIQDVARNVWFTPMNAHSLASRWVAGRRRTRPTDGCINQTVVACCWRVTVTTRGSATARSSGGPVG